MSVHHPSVEQAWSGSLFSLGTPTLRFNRVSHNHLFPYLLVKVTSAGANTQIQSIFDRMREPLLQLLFPAPVTSFSSASSPSRLSATRPISRPIDLIISDIFVLPPIWKAYERNIITYLFMPDSLVTLTHYVNRSIDKIESGELGLSFDHQLYKTIPRAKGLICNSILELDQQVLNELRRQPVPFSNIPVLFVAPLMFEDIGQKRQAAAVASIKQWLDIQWERANKSPSVIYIAFGSWARLPSKQLVQIARALTQFSFIWSLKAKLQVYIPSSLMDNQRHLLLDWTPQRFILSHPATRIFISHAGWNSLLESMSVGKPVLAWPLFGNQMVSGHRVEHEFGMGRCIQNTDLTHSQRIVSSDELTRYLKEMFDQEAKYIRKARQVQQILVHARENSSRLYFEEIIKTVDNQMAAHMKKHNEL